MADPQTLPEWLDLFEQDAEAAGERWHAALMRTWSVGAVMTPNSTGWNVRSIDLDRVGCYAESLEDMPTEDMIDKAVDIARWRKRPMAPAPQPAAAGGGEP